MPRRHVPQLSGNGREGEYGRNKSWGSEIVIANQQKSGVRKQSLKKRARFYGEESQEARGKAIKQSRRGEIEKQQNQQSYIVW
jgi:hypothetical protein